jgi:EAL domain-containing protein (putative c-di-GMP-specific phosphodiesterase class I)
LGVLTTAARARSLSDRGLVPTGRATLDAHGCAADRLVFEVTETASVTDMAVATDSMRVLQELDACVVIADFGTGYSSLLHLEQLSANEFTIDRSFVEGLGGDSYDTAMVASLIFPAHSLNVRCVAEGIEAVGQLRLLEQPGCDVAQGYLFSAPSTSRRLA